MEGRRAFRRIIAGAIALHAWGAVHALLPAQDGLKFLRAARWFQTRDLIDAVRATDQHPLYPRSSPCAALVETVPRRRLELLAGLGANRFRPRFDPHVVRDSWSDSFAVRSARGESRGLDLRPAAVPHADWRDTLADALALSCFAWTMFLGARLLRSASIPNGIGCGLAAGLGFLTRPEVALAAGTIAITAIVEAIRLKRSFFSTIATGRSRAFSVSVLVFLSFVGVYALIKGEVSEKLSLRLGATLPPSASVSKKAIGHGLPNGLDDPRWDFSPKEETTHLDRFRTADALRRLVASLVESLGWAFAIFAIWGAVRATRIEGSNPIRLLIFIYSLIFILALVRNATTLGYMSDRHALSLVVLSVPWSAAGMLVIGRRLSRILRWNKTAKERWAGAAILALMIVVGVSAQVRTKQAHESRIGHFEAGRWLREHARNDEAIYDSRGWASFVAEHDSYDPWHVRQALTDSRLTYLVIGEDELTAPVLAPKPCAIVRAACAPAETFPKHYAGSHVSVRIFRFQRPKSWEGLRP